MLGMSDNTVPTLNTQNLAPGPAAGFCVWLTGLSGAGKSTTAEALASLLSTRGHPATLLDGDIVRRHLCQGLGFSRKDRRTNVLRVGSLASEILRDHGAAICATISPYSDVRDEVRALVGKERFILVFVDTPLEICEQRDPKGLYAKARRGDLPGFTGIDDPYEIPTDPDVLITTTNSTPLDNAKRIFDCLIAKQLLGAPLH